MSSVADTNAAQSAPPVVEIEAVLAPIPGEHRAGALAAGLYDEIMKEVRVAVDPNEAGKGNGAATVIDWERASALTTEALKTRTKDLMIAGRMVESLIRVHGLAGLRDGLKIISQLHESYWDDLHPPMAEDGDLEARASRVAKMGEWAAVALGETPLTDDGSGTTYNYTDWRRGELLRQSKSETDKEKGKDIEEAWTKAANATPFDFYETAHATLEECSTEFQSLARAMSKYYGKQNAGTGKLADTLKGVRSVVGATYRERLKLEPPKPAASSPAKTATAQAGGVPQRGAGKLVAANGLIKTRQEAIDQLHEVAAFFRRTEPQSPVAYLVERAIKWSDMPLELWLASVIKDNSVLAFIKETLGVETPGVEPPQKE